jgi:hypothetical protein
LNQAQYIEAAPTWPWPTRFEANRLFIGPSRTIKKTKLSCTHFGSIHNRYSRIDTISHSNPSVETPSTRNKIQRV